MKKSSGFSHYSSILRNLLVVQIVENKISVKKLEKMSGVNRTVFRMFLENEHGINYEDGKKLEKFLLEIKKAKEEKL